MSSRIYPSATNEAGLPEIIELDCKKDFFTTLPDETITLAARWHFEKSALTTKPSHASQGHRKTG